jgi:hypothetical protein
MSLSTTWLRLYEPVAAAEQVADHLNLAFDRGKRIAQVVRHHRDELVACRDGVFTTRPC